MTSSHAFSTFSSAGGSRLISSLFANRARSISGSAKASRSMPSNVCMEEGYHLPLRCRAARSAQREVSARTFSAWSHVVSLLYAQLTHSVGLNDVCDALGLHSSPLSSLLGATPPSRNNLSHANKVRTSILPLSNHVQSPANRSRRESVVVPIPAETQEFPAQKHHHAGDTNSLLSRSAANARHALMSSRVSSEKLSRISSSLMPSARYSRRAWTVMRIPRIHGLPLRLPGSIVMIFE